MYRNKIIFLIVLAVLSYLGSTAQNKDAAIVESLNEVIIPIETLKPDSNFSDIGFLKQTLASKDIIALGEATHGTHEFFIYKDRLIRFLVAELDYKAIAFESDFIAVQHLDDYVNNETDTIKFMGGFPLIKETRAMLSWLRDYNKTKPLTDRVHLYGLEARGFRKIAIQLMDVLPELPESAKRPLLKLKETDYSLLNKRDLAEVNLILPLLYEETEKGGFIDRHYVQLLEQQTDNYLKTKNGYRDQFMAENASWIIENTANKKLIIWAHNGHVAKSELFNRITMGGHLHQKYGDDYYVIATDFNHGEVSLFVTKDKKTRWQSVYYPEVDTPKGYEYYFKQCQFKNFFIDIGIASRDPNLNSFLDKVHEMRMIGGTDKPVNTKLSILSSFDLLVFMNHTTAID